MNPILTNEKLKESNASQQSEFVSSSLEMAHKTKHTAHILMQTTTKLSNFKLKNF
jgi:hypothetical protein